ncbi:hypothetical protein AAFC00_003735 [Neodothiora populina]|uniref:Phosphoglycerate mutase-like protein n=1 Tax=Neodothiora populina TaxID=2781224 RepID=A0ABR3PFI1_9PEZI
MDRNPSPPYSTLLAAAVALTAISILLLAPSLSIATGALAASVSQILPPLTHLYESHRSGWWTSFSGDTEGERRDGGEGDWDLLYHLGGNGPWIRKMDGVVGGLDDEGEREGEEHGGGVGVPRGCMVDQVHMLSRHAERYPTGKAGIRMLELYHRLRPIREHLNGSLSFVRDWDFFIPDPQSNLESLVSTGPYAGTLSAFSTGVKLRTRYSHLVSDALNRRKTTSLWASSSKRVVETAKYFAAGFWGLDWESSDKAQLYIVPESADRGADTLTPGDTCKDYAEDKGGLGRAYGYRQLATWQRVYLPPIVERLNGENKGLLNTTAAEVYVMQEMCGFETLASGVESPWCGVFSRRELEHFEYARDLLHFHRAGPGNAYGASMGWLWLNATTELLVKGPREAGGMFFSFAHDGDIIPLLAALDILSPSHNSSSSSTTNDLPTTNVPLNRTWRTSTLVPMHGRVILERLSCFPPVNLNSSSSISSSPSIRKHMTRNTDPNPIDSDKANNVAQAHYNAAASAAQQAHLSARENDRQPKEQYCFAPYPAYPHMVYCQDLDDETASTEQGMSRSEDDASLPTPTVYVRVNINDGTVAVPDCRDGPGQSCEIRRWRERTERRGRDVGDFEGVCGIDGGLARGRLEFLHQ